MAINFAAIDFETANGFRGSPCAVGIVVVRDGEVCSETEIRMRPPAGYDHFSSGNIRIHGIHPEDVAQCPRFGAVLDRIVTLIDGLPVMAHNAAFDMGVIRSAAEVSGLPCPTIDFCCSVRMSRQHFELPSYRLPLVAEAAGSPLLNHHNGLADARACADIVLCIAKDRQLTDLDQVVAGLDLEWGHMDAASYIGVRGTGGRKRQLTNNDPETTDGVKRHAPNNVGDGPSQSGQRGAIKPVQAHIFGRGLGPVNR